FSPDEKRLAIARNDNTVTLVDLQTNRRITYPANGTQGLAFSPDGKRLHSLGFDGYVKTWDTTRTPEMRASELIAGRAARTFDGGLRSPDGGLVARIGPSSVIVCDGDSGKELWKHEIMIKEGPGKVSRVEFSPDGRYLLAGSTRSTSPLRSVTSVSVWEAK